MNDEQKLKSAWIFAILVFAIIWVEFTFWIAILAVICFMAMAGQAISDDRRKERKRDKEKRD